MGRAVFGEKLGRMGGKYCVGMGESFSGGNTVLGAGGSWESVGPLHPYKEERV